MTIKNKDTVRQLLTLSDVAEILQCSEKTVKRRVATGDLPVVRDGRLVRVHPDDLDRYVKLRRSL